MPRYLDPEYCSTRYLDAGNPRIARYWHKRFTVAVLLREVAAGIREA